ncbi:hypothetical protein VUR80DRAFT_7705 [Thermomyces stellatus]
MTEFPALEVFVHRHRDAKVFTDGIKKLGFKSNQFTVSVERNYIKIHLVRELSPEQRKYVRKYVDEVYAASDSSEWT